MEGMMGDALSQNDLNALLGLGADGGATDAPPSAKDGNGSSGGLSQADLDGLLGDLGEIGASAGTESAAAQAAPEAKPDAGGDNLSQDEIDKLLAEFGK